MRNVGRIVSADGPGRCLADYRSHPPEASPSTVCEPFAQAAEFLSNRAPEWIVPLGEVAARYAAIRWSTRACSPARLEPRLPEISRMLAFCPIESQTARTVGK